MDKLLAVSRAKPVVPTGFVNGAVHVDPEESDVSSSDSESGEDNLVYEQKFVAEEMEKYATFTKQCPEESEYETMSEVDGIEDMRPRGLAHNIFDQYNFKTTFQKKKLPIDDYKENILQIMNINSVVVIQGDTGCGKSTQVPQFILDDCRERKQMCNIVVTQPRKIATITVAQRVCQERGWTVGTVCGYQIGLEKKTSTDCLLTYMTTGVLLQKLISRKNLHEFTHIIIDEVHERNQDLDFLLLVVRKYLFTNSPQTKLILMSATIDAADFAHYFRNRNIDGDIKAPIIFVNKKSDYQKQIFYGDQLSPKSLPVFDIGRPEINESTWALFDFIIKAFDKLTVQDPITKETKIGSVLVFLPGIHEIEEANRRLKKIRRDHEQLKWEIIPLHSSLPNDEQAKAFREASKGHRKIILSTNIAESSVTVPDICFVIDFCLTKVMTVDPSTKFCSLRLEWASHVNCEQRAGRVGRVSNGRVYRFVTKDFYINHMEQKSVPEIKRAPLERVVLQAKMLNMTDTPKQILALAMDPPNLKNIENTIWSLKECGGLLQTCRGQRSPIDGDITFMGIVMAGLPIDVHLSKLIILGHIFNCLREAIIMAAGCSINNIFAIPFEKRFNAYKKSLFWADGSCSDPIALLNLYEVWLSYKRDNHFESVSHARIWCSQNYVSYKGLNEWGLLIDEVTLRLKSWHIEEMSSRHTTTLSDAEKPTVIKVITCGAFYPNYFIRTANSQIDEKDAVRTLSGRDPYRTVYLTGFPTQQPGQVYVRAIKNLFQDETHKELMINVGFDGSQKIYIEFKRQHEQPLNVVRNIGGQKRVCSSIPGKIPIEVYEAIRLRQLKHPMTLKIMPLDKAWEFAKKFGLKEEESRLINPKPDIHCFSDIEYNPLPTLDTQFIRIFITTTVDAAHFWCQNATPETENHCLNIERCLNQMVLHPALDSASDAEKLTIGKIYAAKWAQDGKFYRCKVNAYNGKQAYVSFIDFGNIQTVKVDELCNIPSMPVLNIAPLAIECVLRGIKPCLKKSHRGVWSDESNDFVKQTLENKVLNAKVYSVVDTVVHLDLYYRDYNKRQYIMNEVLVDKNFAEPAEESYLSQKDNEKRQQVSISSNPVDNTGIGSEVMKNYSDFESPYLGSNYSTITLKGPMSPLEMTIYGVCESSSTKNILIESSSVNTVLVDSEPQDQHARLVVAGRVHQSMAGDTLRLRDTTLMPSVPGLPMLMALLFCPTMEPKLTDDGTRVASILCGLGCHDITDRPLFQNHDMVIPLDTFLEAKEIDEINNIRYMMNSCIKNISNLSQEHSDSDQQEIVHFQSRIKASLFDLIYWNRKTVQTTMVKYYNVWKKSVTDALVLQSEQKSPDDIWPMLWFVKLRERGNSFHKVSKNLEDMEYMAKEMIPAEDITCQLCGVECRTVYEIRFHLISDAHKANRKIFQEQVESEDL